MPDGDTDAAITRAAAQIEAGRIMADPARLALFAAATRDALARLRRSEFKLIKGDNDAAR